MTKNVPTAKCNKYLFCSLTHCFIFMPLPVMYIYMKYIPYILHLNQLNTNITYSPLNKKKYHLLIINYVSPRADLRNINS
jgi:hypothetical protein